MFKKNKSIKITEPDRLFGLALTAPLFEHNQHEHDSLYGGSKKEIARQMKPVLERDWGISSADQLKTTIKSVSQNGHNSDYMAQQSFFNQLSEKQSLSYVNLVKQNQDSDAMIIVNNYKNIQHQNGIIAWDLARVICLARWGAAVGFLTDDEAWEIIMNIAKSIQRLFSGWKEYAVSYFSGRQFWMEDASDELTNQLKSLFKKLINDQSGVWYKINWNTPL